jgi:hypothetical protein
MQSSPVGIITPMAHAHRHYIYLAIDSVFKYYTSKIKDTLVHVLKKQAIIGKYVAV